VTGLAALAIFAAAVAAGAINAVVGSGSLITFPTLLAFGFAPVVANVSNNVGIIPGNISASVGYRAELTGQRGRLWRLGLASLAGAVAGAVALLALPPSVFKLVVPALIIVGCLLVLVQPKLAAWVAGRGEHHSDQVGPFLIVGVFLTGVYGGYFGAAQGVLLVGLLGVFLTDSLQRINAGKNVLVTIVNGAAAVIFVIFAHIAWLAVALIAAGSAAGGLIGAKLGRKLPPLALRIIIVVIGVISAVKLIFFP
jgi:uncharacterized membrane protein YfcA